MRVGQNLLKISLFLVLLISNGCMLGPNYVRPPAQVAEEWMDVSESGLSGNTAEEHVWWAVFNDPILDQLVTMAYGQNLTLQQAGLRILQSRARLGIAVGQIYPQLQEATGAYSRTKASVNTSSTKSLSRQPTFDRDTNLFDTGFDAAWEIDIWGRFRRRVEAANADVLASIASYDDILVSLVAEVAATYVQLRTLEERLRLAQENVQIQARSLQIADVRFRYGAVTELDVQQAAALLRNTEATIPDLEASIRQAQNRLSVLLGSPPRSLNDILDGARPIPQAPPEVAVGMPTELLRRRPDIRQAEREMAAQSARIGIAQTDLYPAFSLFGSFSFSAEDIDNMFEGRSVQAVGGPSFNWPLFHYGRLRNNIRVQDAQFQELVVNYQDTVLRAAQDVEDAIIAYLRSQEQVGFLTQSVEASKRSVDLALIQYRDGAIDYTRVLDSQEFLVAQQDRLAATQGNIALNLVAMYKALGGGWQIRTGQAFVPAPIQQEMQQRTNWGPLLPEALDAPLEDDVRWWFPVW